MRLPIACALVAVGLLSILALTQSAEAQANLPCSTVPCVAWQTESSGGGAASRSYVATTPDGTQVFVATGENVGGSLDWSSAAYDAGTGALQWIATHDGPFHSHDLPTAIAVAPDGSAVFVTGWDITGSPGQDQVTIAYDADSGALLWEARFDPGQGDGAWGMALAGGRLVVVGDTQTLTPVSMPATMTAIAYDPGSGQQLWAQQYPGTASKGLDVVASPNGDRFYIAGRVADLTGVGTTKGMVVIGIDAANGAQMWKSDLRLGTTVLQPEEVDFTLTPDGTRLLVSGGEGAKGTTFLAAYDATGALTGTPGRGLWQAALPLAQTGTGTALDLNGDGSLAFLGGTLSKPALGNQAAVAAFDTVDGTLSWQTAVPHPGTAETFAGLQVSATGDRIAVLSNRGPSVHAALVSPMGSLLASGLVAPGTSSWFAVGAVSQDGSRLFIAGTTITGPNASTKVVMQMDFASKSSGSTLLVGGNEPFRFETIQAAIDAARDGDTVKVAPGVYHENIVVDKAIVMHGAGSGTSPLESTIVTRLLPAVDATCATAVENMLLRIRSSDVAVRGIRLDGGRVPQPWIPVTIFGGGVDACPQAYGVLLEGEGTLARITLEDVAVVGTLEGLSIGIPRHHAGTTAPAGIQELSVSNATFEGNRWDIIVASAPSCPTCGLGPVEGVVILDSTFRSTTGPAITITSTGSGPGARDGFQIAGNQFDGACANAAIRLGGGFQGNALTIERNVFNGVQPLHVAGSSTAAHPVQGNDVTFSGNTVHRNCETTGTRFMGQDGVSILIGTPGGFAEGITPPGIAPLPAQVVTASTFDLTGNDWGAYTCKDVRSQIVEVPGSSNELQFVPYVDASGAVMEDDCPVWVERGDERVEPFFTIQDGIDAAQDGDTVNVGPGTYPESLVIEKGLTLLGSGSGADSATSTILTGACPIAAVSASPCTTPGVVISHGDVTMRSFNLQGPGLPGSLLVVPDGIVLGALDHVTSNVTIEDVAGSQWYDVVELRGPLVNVTLRGVDLRDALNGINYDFVNGRNVTNLVIEGSSFAGIRGFPIFLHGQDARVGMRSTWSVRIADNVFSRNGLCGVHHVEFAALEYSAVSVEGNHFDQKGVSMAFLDESTVHIHGNSFAAPSPCVASPTTTSVTAGTMIGQGQNAIQWSNIDGSQLAFERNEWGAYACASVEARMVQAGMVANSVLTYEPWLSPSSVPQDDCPGPVLTLPAGMALEATSSAGAVATYTATAYDEHEGPAAVTCSPASGSNFPIGTTVVYCTASDEVGNTATGSFQVTVGDSTPPVLTLPASVSAAATSVQGATVQFAASASDLVDGALAVTCSKTSGSQFALASTTVTCSATDANGNTASGSFAVAVTYSWSGFQGEATEGANLHGRWATVRFALTGDSAPITNAPAKLWVTGANGIETPAVGRSVLQGNSLTYGAAQGAYSLDWDTHSVADGTYTLRVELGDGVTRTITVAVT